MVQRANFPNSDASEVRRVFQEAARSFRSEQDEMRVFNSTIGYALAGDAFFWQGLAALLVLTLMAAIRASGSITEEKEKGTWLALMVTPLSTEEIIAGKMRGIFSDCIPYVAAHAYVTLLLAMFLGYWAMIWAFLWVAVMVLAVGLCGALGLWCSARATSSWRSLLTTLPLCYFGGILLFWRPSGLSADAGLLPVILGGAFGLWCATRAALSWRSLLTVLVFYLGWFVLFSPFGLFSAIRTPIVTKGTQQRQFWPPLCPGLFASGWRQRSGIRRARCWQPPWPVWAALTAGR